MFEGEMVQGNLAGLFENTVSSSKGGMGAVTGSSLEDSNLFQKINWSWKRISAGECRCLKWELLSTNAL